MRIKRKPLWKRPTGAVLAALALAVLVWAYPVLAHPLLLLHLLRTAPPAELAVPVDGVEPSQLVDTWGAVRSEGRRHEGVDIFAPRGTPVRSTTEGIVLRKGWNRLGGRRVLVLGPGLFSHYYAHLESFAGQEVGDAVGPGEVLGYLGTSGNAAATPPHLHYGIYRWSGQSLDPYPLLGGAPCPAPCGPRQR